jgi:pyridoxine kinase
MNTPKTLVIHSSVAYGYVGSNVTSFLLQINGIETITLPTVVYSNHLGHDIWGGGKIDNQLFENVIIGLEKFGVLAQVNCIVTGYIGTVEQIKCSEKLIKKIKRINPDATYICDPVLGDTQGLYVAENIPQAMQDLLVPIADILTPNAFEFALLTGTKIKQESIKATAEKVFDLSKQDVIITGCSLTQSAKLKTFYLNQSGLTQFTNEEIDVHPAGTGELFTTYLCLQIHRKLPMIDAIKNATIIVERTLQAMKSVARKEFNLADMLYAQQVYQSMEL